MSRWTRLLAKITRLEAERTYLDLRRSDWTAVWRNAKEAPGWFWDEGTELRDKEFGVSKRLVVLHAKRDRKLAKIAQALRRANARDQAHPDDP